MGTVYNLPLTLHNEGCPCPFCRGFGLCGARHHSSALNVWTRCTTSASLSELELTTSGTTWPRTIAPQLKRTSRTSVLRSLPDTTSECWTPLSTTTSWTEPCTCARLWASVTHS